MREDAGFRIALAALLAATFAIRVSHHVKGSQSSSDSVEFESKFNIAVRTVAGLTFISSLVIYLVNPLWLSWASLPMPAWLRWIGLPIGIAGVGGLFWVHHVLGQNFSGSLHLRAEHELVTSGPYRLARHPMYSVFYTIGLSFFLLSASWLFGAGFLVTLSAIMLSRVKREEDVMLERFGDRYRQYMARTGRFLPRLRV
jgi:protein-S-isoprenylcysteine O-methyltransferase Ste14